MNQPYTRVSCPRDLGRKHMFFFNVSDDGTPIPNYCDDADGSDVCHRCAVTALKQLIAETEERLNDPLYR